MLKPFHDEFSADRLWKTLCSKLKGAYEKRTGVKVDFKFAHKAIGDRVQMSELNHLKDNMVVFTSVDAVMDSTPSSSAATRTPLQPVNTQLTATPNASIPAKDNVPVKVEFHTRLRTPCRHP